MEDARITMIKTAGPAVFMVLALLLVFNFADQSLLSPLLNPLLSDFFGQTTDVVPLGWITFVFTLLSALSTIAAGLLADRLSRLRICFAGASTYGLVAVLAILIPHGRAGFIAFFLARALAGLGVGLIVPSVFALAGDLVAANRRSTSFGFLSVAMLAGRMAGFAAGGALAADWRLSYVLIGGINLALAAVLLLLREPPHGAQEPELREAFLSGAVYRFRWTRKEVRALWATPSNAWLIFNFIDVVPGSIILFLIFKYMKDVHNMDAAAVNSAIVGVFLAGAAGALVFGRLGDLWFQRDRRAKVWTALLGNAVPIIFMVLFLSSRVWVPDGAGVREALAAPGVLGLVLAIAAAMFVNQGVNPNWYGTLTDVNLPEHRAAMISFASVMDMTGNALGPLCGSYIASLYGLRTAMAAVLVFWVFNILLWLPVLVHVRPDLGRVHSILSDRASEMMAAAKEKMK